MIKGREKCVDDDRNEIDDSVINQKTDGSFFKRIKSVRRFSIKKIDDQSSAHECSKRRKESEKTTQSNLPNIA